MYPSQGVNEDKLRWLTKPSTWYLKSSHFITRQLFLHTPRAGSNSAVTPVVASVVLTFTPTMGEKPCGSAAHTYPVQLEAHRI